MSIAKLERLVRADTQGNYRRILEAIAEVTLVDGKETAERKDIKKYLRANYPEMSISTLGDLLAPLQSTGRIKRVNETEPEQFVITPKGAAFVGQSTKRNYEVLLRQRSSYL
jgi:predicted transcriptional regulator